MFDSFARGFLLGLAVSLPIGPIGILCIQRSLTQGWLRGMAAGLGATAADLIYACMAAFGISFINDFLVEHSAWFRFPAAAILLFLGYRAFRTRVADGPAAVGSSARTTFAATFSMMLSNPLTLVFFTAAFAALGGSTRLPGTAPTLLLILGVATGSLLWWGVLAGVGALLRSRLRPTSLIWVNRISGFVLAAFGLWLLL